MTYYVVCTESGYKLLKASDGFEIEKNKRLIDDIKKIGLKPTLEEIIDS